MAAAQQLFLDKGVDATTISDIVAAAGVAKGTFYHYFQAKTDILLALRERFTQAFQQRIATGLFSGAGRWRYSLHSTEVTASPKAGHSIRLSAARTRRSTRIVEGDG